MLTAARKRFICKRAGYLFKEIGGAKFPEIICEGKQKIPGKRV